MLLTAAGEGREHRKEKKRSKEKRSKKDRGREKGSAKEGKTLDIQRLRAEREAREQVERERARQAIMAGSGGAAKGKAYHGAYGNVAPSKRPLAAARAV
jgi:hypothetical protein